MHGTDPTGMTPGGAVQCSTVQYNMGDFINITGECWEDRVDTEKDYRTITHGAVQLNTGQCSIVQCITVHHSALKSSAAHHSSSQCTVQCSKGKYSAV